MSVRSTGRNFRTLNVWEKSHQLTLDVYKSTSGFPREELFGLTSQIRRAAVSIPANIAEGCGRGGGDFARFCRIAAGSASELQYHLLLVSDLGFLDALTYRRLEKQTTEVERMLAGLIDSIVNGKN